VGITFTRSILKGGKPEFSVTDGEHALSAPLLWAFGTGKVGQSYLFQRERKLFRERVTYFNTLQNIPSRQHARASAPRLEEAMARPVGLPEVKRLLFVP